MATWSSEKFAAFLKVTRLVSSRISIQPSPGPLALETGCSRGDGSLVREDLWWGPGCQEDTRHSRPCGGDLQKLPHQLSEVLHISCCGANPFQTELVQSEITGARPHAPVVTEIMHCVCREARESHCSWATQPAIMLGSKPRLSTTWALLPALCTDPVPAKTSAGN